MTTKAKKKCNCHKDMTTGHTIIEIDCFKLFRENINQIREHAWSIYDNYEIKIQLEGKTYLIFEKELLKRKLESL